MLNKKVIKSFQKRKDFKDIKSLLKLRKPSDFITPVINPIKKDKK